MPVKVSLDENSLRDAQWALIGVQKGIPRATSRALNRTFTGVRTDMVTLIRTDYNIKSGAARKRITIRKANVNDLAGYVQSAGPLPNLTDFATTKQTARGVTVNVKKSTGRHLLPGFFIAPAASSDKQIVLGRPIDPATGRRYPRYGERGTGGSRRGSTGPRARLKVRYGPHPELLLNTQDNWAELQDKAQTRLDTNFSREVKAILEGYAK